jgi:hypothetical protein
MLSQTEIIKKLKQQDPYIVEHYGIKRIGRSLHDGKLNQLRDGKTTKLRKCENEKICRKAYGGIYWHKSLHIFSLMSIE